MCIFEPPMKSIKNIFLFFRTKISQIIIIFAADNNN